MRGCLALAVLFLGFLPASAQTQASAFSRFGGHAGIGTTGPRLDVVTNVSPRVNARLSSGLFTESLVPVDIDTDQSIEGTDFSLDNEIDYLQVGLLADYFPLRRLRLSAGLFYAKRDLKSTITPLEAVSEGGVTYTPDQIGSLRVEGSFGSAVAPYVGVGYGNALGTGRVPIGFFAEVGGYYHGSPDVRLVADDPASVIAPSASAANEQILEERLGWYRFYPEVSLGVSFRFN